MNRWKIRTHYIAGELVYQVYRLLDVNDYDHDGNREIIGTFSDEASASEFAAELNQRAEGRRK